MDTYTSAKQRRQRQLLTLLARAPLPSQEEMRRRLAAAGIRVTQATLSRDIKELGLARTREGYQRVGESAPALPLPPPLAHLVKEFVRTITEAGQLLVLKTSPGSASSVAASLDAQAWKELAGTIAGDDTILIVAPHARAARQVRSRLEKLLEE